MIAEREAAAADVVDSAVARIAAHPFDAFVPEHAGANAIAAILGIVPQIDAAPIAALEIRRAIAFVRRRVADLMLNAALRGVRATGQALARFLVAVGESTAT